MLRYGSKRNEILLRKMKIRPGRIESYRATYPVPL